MKGLRVIQNNDGTLCKGTTLDYIDYVNAKGTTYLTELTNDEIEIYKYGFAMGRESKKKEAIK